jgi:hypothetical protein
MARSTPESGGETRVVDRTASVPPAAEGQEADMSALTAALVVVAPAPRERG